MNGRGTTLGRVRAYFRRSAAAVTALCLVSFSSVPASAEEPTLLDPRDCAGSAATPDGEVPQSWAIERLGMPEAWSMATGKGVTVAVIDTGVAAVGTPYFTPDRITTYNLVSPEVDAEARQQNNSGGLDCQHGTWVAGILAGGRTNGAPVDTRTNFSGIAPDATIISYRVLTRTSVEAKEDGSTTGDPVGATITAIRHAIAQDVDIINMSQVVTGADPLVGELGKAVQEALDAGIVVVAAAGNANEEGTIQAPLYPANFPGVINVGMTQQGDKASPASIPYSQEMTNPVTIAAPGDGVMAINPSRAVENATYSNQSYEPSIQGTSFATPVVSGVIALLLEREPDLTPEQVKQRLVATADPPGDIAPSPQLGWGIINPVGVLAGVPAADTAGQAAPAPQDAEPLPAPQVRDMAPVWWAVGLGTAAVILALLGLVLAITLPPALRRNRVDPA